MPEEEQRSSTAAGGKQTTTAAEARTTGNEPKDPQADEQASKKDPATIPEAEGENKRVAGDPNQGTESR
ncbi:MULTISPECIES: hypothetical protein [unclassified Coleofasciculus]|uniref:hypothetical protein n=1 Tax=unclassified Coleofasciculus TaxID=2692782 RepID=UPI00187DE907|nr:MULTISPECIES: hypothetical protein [unclassified Coleofasciculus]MBE9126559.1 hypothetical protein [Coleofasciculus sp. LEGE 07081]MBE9149993.1 hypothetical protein [Coleofasciculus sp. LEGE 07092]